MIKHKKFALLLLILLFSATALLITINADLYNIDNLKRSLAGLGKLSPLIFVLLCTVRTFVLLPCGLFSAAGGVLFGPIKGTMLTLAGFTFNSLIIYYMANYLGRDFVKRLLKDKFNYIDNYVSKNSFFSFLLMRIVPILPFDAVSCIAGISKAKPKNFLAATAIGSIPGVFIYSWFGDSLKALSYEKIAISGVFIILMAIVPLLYKLIKHRHLFEKNINKHNRTSI